MRHHAARNIFRLDVMAGAPAASLRRYTQVSGIDKANKLPTLPGQQSICAFRVRAGVLAVAFPLVRKARADMGLVLDALDLFGIVIGFSWHGIAAVAGGARQSH